MFDFIHLIKNPFALTMTTTPKSQQYKLKFKAEIVKKLEHEDVSLHEMAKKHLFVENRCKSGLITAQKLSSMQH